MIKDMTVGNPTSLILRFSFPLLLGNIFQQLYQISDIVIVGRLIGVEALAAVGASAPLFFMLLLIAFGFTAGLTVVTAQRFGAKDEKGVRRSVTHSLIAGIILSFLLTLPMLLWLPEILRFMNVPAEILGDAVRFIRILSSGLVLIVSYNLLSGFIRALGDSKTPLYFLILTSLLNIILNFIFIYVFKLGVAGSAIGTLIAMSISVVCCLIYIHRRFPILRLTRSDWVYNPQFMKEHLRIAIPMSIQFSIIAVSLMITQTVCNSFGADTIAAFTSALRIEQLATQPLIALGIGIATYTAQNFGAGKITRIRRGVIKCSLISITFSILLAVSVRLWGENMVDIFIKDGNPEIIKMARAYLDISTLFYVFLGQIFIFRYAIQGTGRYGIPMFACAVELVMRSFAAIYLAKSFGYIGICYASPIAWIGAALVVTFGYLIVLRQIRRSFIKNHLRYLAYKLSLGTIQTVPQTTPAE